MKKLFALAAVVAVALTSCVTTTEIPDPAGEIAFEAFNFKAQSRAVYGPIVGSAYPADEHFGAYAFFTESPYAVYMNNVEIQKDTDNAWRNIAKKYYWPKGGILKFWCYSPYGTNHTVTHDNGFAFPNYTTTANLAQQVDLMATEVIAEARPAAVAAVFHHLLAQVGFTAQCSNTATTAGATITLDRVELSNVKSKGTYTAGAWDALSEEMTYNFVSTGSANAQTLTESAEPVLPKLVPNATNALVIPQDGTGNIIATIDYTITYDTGAVDKVTNVKFDIPAPWVQGKKYIYVITIGVSGEITFNPTVNEWTEGTGGTFTVS